MTLSNKNEVDIRKNIWNKLTLDVKNGQKDILIKKHVRNLVVLTDVINEISVDNVDLVDKIGKIKIVLL